MTNLNYHSVKTELFDRLSAQISEIKTIDSMESEIMISDIIYQEDKLEQILAEYNVYELDGYEDLRDMQSSAIDGLRIYFNFI